MRYLLARRPALCRAVRRIFLRAVFSLYRKRAVQEGIPRGRTGAVNRIQRFGSSLNLKVHFHALLLDGVHPGLAGMGTGMVAVDIVALFPGENDLAASETESDNRHEGTALAAERREVSWTPSSEE